jgi:sterol desaturase/sphingolipid hydroxylase (fatty acid hydroxylase superfamily)
MSLILYPIPSHVGFAPFERHHYDHHTKFNYNYGSSQLWDVVCGTTYEDFSSRKGVTVSDAAKNRANEAKRQQEMAMGGD